MAIKFNRSQTFATNGTVTATGLHNLVDGLDIYQALITDQTNLTSVGTADELLIADADLTANDAPRAVTVQELFDDALTVGTYTNAQLTGNLTYGTATGNRTVSTNASITTGTINNATLYDHRDCGYLHILDSWHNYRYCGQHHQRNDPDADLVNGHDYWRNFQRVHQRHGRYDWHA